MSQQKHSQTELWLPNTQVIGVYSFRGKDTGDLSFHQGETLTIIKPTKGPNWYLARNIDGRQGVVPTNYLRKKGQVKPQTMPWLHGRMSSMEAEQKLTPRRKGFFLVHESEEKSGSYILSVCTEINVVHYHIKWLHNKLTIDEENLFENLTQLVEYYKNSGHLATTLTEYAENRGNLSFSVDPKCFQQEGWFLNPEHIQLGELIGRGDFANVYKAEYKHAKMPLVAKEPKEESRAKQLILVEAAFMTHLHHPNLVKLIGVVIEGPKIQIITEYLANGSLLEYLRTRGRAVITEQDQFYFARDTCRGMTYLENTNLVHGDLAARNVLINEKGVAKVSDFGLSRPMDITKDVGKLPIKWMAPEAVKEHRFTNKSDMWSFGILLWEIYSFGRVPYPRIPVAEVLRHIERGYRNNQPDGCPDGMYEIMEQAWNLNPVHRPTFYSVIRMFDRMQVHK